MTPVKGNDSDSHAHRHHGRFRLMVSMFLGISALVHLGLLAYQNRIAVVPLLQADEQMPPARKYQPWNCDAMRRQVRLAATEGDNSDSTRTTSQLDWADPNDKNIYVRYVDAVPNAPPFYMSLAMKEYDQVRWEIFEKGVYYEDILSETFVDILRDPKMKQLQAKTHDVRVIDVGCNQGWFSVLSAAMGYPVDAFDPNPVNSLRICESNAQNGWAGDGYLSSSSSTESIVNVFNYGVSDVTDVKIPFTIPKNNPGQATFLSLPKKDERNNYYSNMTLLTLDAFAKERGWLESTETVIAILKVDAENLEEKVFRGASELLRTGRVRNVLMEATGYKESEAKRSRTVVEYLSGEVGLRLRAYGYWRGPGKDAKNVAGKDAVDIIEKQCFAKKKGCNLWWTKDTDDSTLV